VRKIKTSQRVVDIEKVFSNAYYILCVQKTRQKYLRLSEDFYEDVTAYLITQTSTLGYDLIREMVYAVDKYVNVKDILDSYHGALYESFIEYKEKKNDVE